MTDHTDLIAQLRDGKCPQCNGWGEVAYCGEMVTCPCRGQYEAPISMETRRQAATALEALSQREARLDWQKLQSAYDVLHCIADQAEDEGDRVYFGSTNDPHTMRRQLRVIEGILARAALAEGGEK